jgi:hypothetical protein
MPAPTHTYKIVITSGWVPDVTEVNDLASQGWNLEDMHQIGGGPEHGRFWYLLSRTVTNIKKDTSGKRSG